MNTESSLYTSLSKITRRPPVWETYTAEKLWDDHHISENMLKYHLDPVAVPASRPHSFIDESAEWMIGHFNLGPGKHVADFGCGPGLYSSRFAAAGAAVTGIDFSQRSIAYARSHAAKDNLDVNYVQANYLDYETDCHFDLIALIYCDYCALSSEQRPRLLGKLRDCLKENGRIILDVFTATAYDGRLESREFAERLMEGFWAAGDYSGFRHTWKYDAESVILDKYDIIEPNREWTVYNWLQYFSRDSLLQEFAENGLNIIQWFDDVNGAPCTDINNTVAIVAERRIS